MEILGAAALANVCLATAVGTYQLWLFVRRPEYRAALWAGIISLSAAVFAMCQVVAYETTTATVARSAIIVSFVALVVLTHVVPTFSAALTQRPLPWWRNVAIFSGGGWIVLIVGTSWVVPYSVASIELTLLPHPYLQPESTGLTAFFFLYCVLVSAFGTWWLVRYREHRHKERIFFIGMAIWIVAGSYDALATLGIFGNPPAFFLEHGFLMFILAIFARSVREHADALDRQEQALVASEASFRQLIEKSPEVIAVYREGQIVYVNQTCAHYLGYDSPQEMVGMSIIDVVHPEDRQLAMERIGKLEQGQQVPSVEERLVCKDGTVLTTDLIALPVTFEDQPSVVVIGHDLTERVKLEARMMQLDRMVSIGTLAAGVAHEINNPLTFVLGNISALRRDVAELDQALGSDLEPGGESELIKARTIIDSMGASLDDAAEGGERIHGIVRDLSGLSRSTVREQHPVSIPEVVEPALKLASNEVKHRARLECDYRSTSQVMADSARLCQVVLNLVVNAAHSIPIGHASENTISIRTKMRAGKVVLEVSDSGSGISEELKDRIFEPFVTTKPPGQGTGLGLSICRQIIHDHGGEIEVASEVGRGSTFSITLPPSESGVAVKCPSLTVPSSDSPPRRGRVLVVDDEPMIVRSIKRLLSPEHDVDGTTGATEALALLEIDQDYHIILCDLMMPEMSGMDFFEALRDRWPEVADRMVFMTGGAFGPEVSNFTVSLDVPPIQKPFDPAHLRKIVRKRMDSLEEVEPL